jgi:hypothetical protein
MKRSSVLSLEHFLERLLDIDGLARVEDNWVKTGMVSTYNRSGGNADGFTLMTPEGEERVMARRLPGPELRYETELRPGDRVVVADLEGPGCIDRLYCATPGGRLRIYLDDAREATVDARCRDVFEGRLPAFPAPLAGRRGRGFYSYVPIPFSRRCRIEIEVTEPSGETLDLGFGNYYQVSYRRFTPQTKVASFPESLSPTQAGLIGALQAQWTSTGSDPRGDAAYEWIEGEADILAGATTALAEIGGEGWIGQLWLAPADESAPARTFLRRTSLRCFWDGSPFPSVNVPLGDFFGYCR